MTDAWQLVRRRWWLLLLGVLAAAVPTVLVSERLPRVYEARATVLVSPGSSAELGSGLTPDQLTTTYAGIIKARPILNAVAERAGLSSDEVDASLNVAPVPDTRFLQLLVRATTPEQAAGLANLIADTAAKKMQEMRATRYSGRLDRLSLLVDTRGQDVLARSADVQMLSGQEVSPARDAGLNVAQAALAQAQLRYRDAVARLDDFKFAQLGGGETITIAEPALPPQTPIFPRMGANVFTAVVVGLVIAIVLALLLNRFDDSLPSPGEWPKVLDVAVLGVIRAADPTILASVPGGQIDDTFRHIRARLPGAPPQQTSRTLAVTSVAEQAGSTTVAVGLATALARAGERVILVDANLSRPAIATLFAVNPSCDLITLLTEPNAATSSAVLDTTMVNLRLVGGGSPSSARPDLLSSPSLARRLAELRELADVVVVDAPAVTYSEALVVATSVDAVICVLDPRRTSLSTTSRALALLRAVGAPVVGVVLSRVTAPPPTPSRRDAIGLQPSAEQS